MKWPEFQWPRRLPPRVVLGLATLAPLGNLGPGPGTLGTLAGLGFLVVLLRSLPTAGLLAVSAGLGWRWGCAARPNGCSDARTRAA